MDAPNSRLNLALATVAFGISFAVWSLLAPLAPEFQKTLGLTDTQTGLMLAIPVLLGSLARIPMGILTDRFGGRKVFTLLLLFSIIPVTFLGMANSYQAILFWGFWLGLAGSSFAIGVPFVSRWFSAGQQGTALGIYGAGNIGTAIAAYSVPWIALTFGWPYAFWLFIPVLAIMAAVFWFFAQDAPAAPRPSSLSASLQVVRQEPLAWVFSLFYFVTFGGFVAFSVYLPKLLIDWFEFSKTDAGMRTAGFVVIATIARPLGGYLADRVGGARLLAWVFGLAPILALLLAYESLSPDLPAVTFAFLSMAALMGLGNGAVFKLVAQYFPRNTGIVTGVVGAAGGIGGFFPPMVMGLVRDFTGSYALGLIFLATFALGCLWVDLRLMRQNRQTPSSNQEQERTSDGSPPSPGQGGQGTRTLSEEHSIA